MNDGRTHLSDKTEHFIDLENEVILLATVYSGTDGDAQTQLVSVVTTQIYLDECDSGLEIEEVATDKGYHSNETLASS